MMADTLPELPEATPGGRPGGLLTENIMHFARVLRRAGLPIGPGQVLDIWCPVRDSNFPPPHYKPP